MRERLPTLILAATVGGGARDGTLRHEDEVPANAEIKSVGGAKRYEGERHDADADDEQPEVGSFAGAPQRQPEKGGNDDCLYRHAGIGSWGEDVRSRVRPFAKRLDESAQSYEDVTVRGDTEAGHGLRDRPDGVRVGEAVLTPRQVARDEPCRLPVGLAIEVSLQVLQDPAAP